MGNEEPSVVTLLKTAGASNLLSSEISAITRNSGNVTAVGHSTGDHETSAVMLLHAASNVMNSTSATAVALSSGITGSNEVVETTNIDKNNQVGIQKLLELAGRAEQQRSMESSSTNNDQLPEMMLTTDNSISTSKASCNTAATETAPNTTTSVAAPQPTLPMNASNCSSNEKSTNVAVSTTEATNEEDTSSLSTNNYYYKVCYDVELQNTIVGYMLFLGGNTHNTPYAFDYKVCFEYYK